MAHGDKLHAVVDRDGGDKSLWSRVFNQFAVWLEARWGPKLKNNLEFFRRRFPEYARRICAVSNSLGDIQALFLRTAIT